MNAAQRAAIDRAKQDLADGTDRVHVYGPPTSKLPGERWCNDKDTGQLVIYHPRVVPMSNGGFHCLACGQSSEDPDGEA